MDATTCTAEVAGYTLTYTLSGKTGEATEATLTKAVKGETEATEPFLI